MKLKSVSGSGIVGYSYDQLRKTLTIVFNNNVENVYHGVEPYKAKAFNNAKSKAKFFNQDIRNIHRVTRVR